VSRTYLFLAIISWMIAVIALVIVLTGCSWSKSEMRWGIVSSVATALDCHTTCRMLDNPDNYEMNPLMGKHPSDSRVIAHMALFQAATLTAAHFLPEYRTLILGGKTTVNLGFAVNNIRLEW